MSQHTQFSQDQYPTFNMVNHPPRSPDLLSIHSLGRPTDAQAFTQYASLSPHGTNTREAMGNLQTFAGRLGHQAFMQNQGQLSMMNHSMMNHSMINEFMRDQGEPWNPLRVRANAGAKSADLGAQSAGLPHHGFFGSFRNPAPPSEADTVVSRSVGGLMSDSGYGSMARQSVGNPSIYGGDAEQSADTQSLILQFQRGLPQGSMSTEEEPQKQEGPTQRATSVNRNTNTLTCPVCNVSVKTNSEMKKHEARHNKPHKCDVPGCPKAIEGFSTNNDLERHKRCVHKLRKSDETVYRCGEGQCKDKLKDWPRQDNFKQHLKRKHGLENVDLSCYTHRTSSADLIPLETSEATVPDAGNAQESTFAQMGNTGQLPGRAPLMEERDFASLAGPAGSRCQGQTTPESTLPQLDMDPVFSGVGVQRASPQAASERLPQAGQPSSVPPAFFNISICRPQDLHLGSGQAVQHEVDGLPRPSKEDTRSEHQQVQVDVSDDMSVDDSVHDSDSEDGVDDSDAEDDVPNSPRDAHADPSGDSNSRDESSSASETYIKPSPADLEMGTDTPRPMELEDETRASALIQSLMEKGMLEKILMKVGYQKESETGTKDQKLPTDSSAPASNRRVNKCDDCPKTFHRRCELKKHQKRHEKPYACTFPRCDRKFGSKNDWKRHENSQHFQLEIWRCAERAADRPDEECGRVWHRRESLKSHLEKEHGVSEPAVLDKKLADFRIGRNFGSRFWCGFCQKTIEPTGKGGPAHGERFDHIDDHFSGRGMPKADISQWKHVEPDTADSSAAGTPGKGRREGSAASRSRKRPYSPDEDAAVAPRVKRSKSGAGNKDLYWTCCVCRNYWSKGVTETCLDSCSHALCGDCTLFENEVQDGLTT